MTSIARRPAVTQSVAFAGCFFPFKQKKSTRARPPLSRACVLCRRTRGNGFGHVAERGAPAAPALRTDAPRPACAPPPPPYAACASAFSCYCPALAHCSMTHVTARCRLYSYPLLRDMRHAASHFADGVATQAVRAPGRGGGAPDEDGCAAAARSSPNAWRRRCSVARSVSRLPAWRRRRARRARAGGSPTRPQRRRRSGRPPPRPPRRPRPGRACPPPARSRGSA